MEQNNSKRTKRRALLGAISGAGVVGATKLPGQWAKPVVDQVLLPAHAQTTDSDSSGTGQSTFVTTVTSNCIVTCTSAIGREDNIFSPISTSTDSLNLTQTIYELYTQCVDEFGGSSSSFNSSFSTSFSTPTGDSSFYPPSRLFSSSPPMTMTSICNVTVTSS